MLKKKILSYYFIKHLKVKDIAEELNVTSAYITKIIKQDNRYIEEKLYRKEWSKNKRKIDQNKFIKNKREKQRIEDYYYILKAQHEQASKELSKSGHLTNENYRKWNSSAYNYNPSKRRFEFDENLGRSADVPKYINDRR